MKHIQNKLPYICQNELTNHIFSEDAVFFDIETTGFSPIASTIYLIGSLRRSGSTLIIDQFFAESQEEERELLENFTNLLKGYKTILSFNGVGFDIPFIKAKCISYDLDENLDAFCCIDIFKSVRKMKHLLKLPNYKQKTIEHFLGIQRDDLYSGGELIPVYHEYLKTHSPYSEKLLLLHNREDVAGMLDLISMLAYEKILSGSYSIEDAELSAFTDYNGNQKKELLITLTNTYEVPKRVSYQSDGCYFVMNKNTTKIRIPIYEGELRYFYPNYKEYYYLPIEDMAIHRSVASFVDKEYREKAKAANCYNRKTGVFLPQYETIIEPAFKQEYKDKSSFFELTEEFLSSTPMLQKYVSHIFENYIN